MVSFASSAINKSRKKFAPKAAVRRAAPAPPVPTPKTTIQVPTPPFPTTQRTRRPSTTEQAGAESSVTEPLVRPNHSISTPALAVPDEGDNTESSLIDDAPRRGSATEHDNRPKKRVKLLQDTEKRQEDLPSASEETINLSADRALVLEAATTSETSKEATQPATTDEVREPQKARKRGKAKGKNSDHAAGTLERVQRQRAPRKRELTPEGADSIEITPAVVKMSDLCKDRRTGRVSKRERELRNMELAEQERKQRAREGAGDVNPEPSIKPNGEEESSAIDGNKLLEDRPQAGPVMRIVNGEIVLDTASLQVDRHADAAKHAEYLEDVVESSFTRKINSATYGKRSKTESWDAEMTDLFYRGLRMFGTDFSMISKMFPGRSRRQIKLKFNNEERRDPERIKQTLLGPRESVDIEAYSEMTDTVFDDPQVVQKGLDEERRRIEEQHAREKAVQEEMLRNPDLGTTSNASAADNRSGLKRKKIVKSVGGGTEEVVGSIDDIPFAGR